MSTTSPLPFLPTFSHVWETAWHLATSQGYTVPLEERERTAFESVSYGETRNFHFTLLTRKGNLAKKRLQVTVHRPGLEQPHMGEYEPCIYIL